MQGSFAVTENVNGRNQTICSISNFRNNLLLVARRIRCIFPWDSSWRHPGIRIGLVLSPGYYKKDTKLKLSSQMVGVFHVINGPCFLNNAIKSAVILESLLFSIRLSNEFYFTVMPLRTGVFGF